MNKSETATKYWDCIKWIQKEAGVSQRTARKFYKHIKRAIIAHHHAESEEEYMYTEDRLNNIWNMMKMHDEVYEKQILNVIVQEIEDIGGDNA